MKFIIDFYDNTTLEEIQFYLSSINGSIIKTYNNFTKTYLVETETQIIESNLVQSYIRDDDKSISLLNHTVSFNSQWAKDRTDSESITLDVMSDNDWWKVYSLKYPNFNSDNNINRKGSDIKVYILDSGIKTNHPEFINRDVSNLWSFNDNFDDQKGHGTAIGSIISGNTCGITNSKLRSVKIFDQGIPTYRSNLIDALDIIFNDYNEDIQSGLIQASIVNCSWAIEKDHFIEGKIKQMIDAGILFVCAAGNNGSIIEDVTPASMPDAITIGAYDKNFRPCDFSAYSGPRPISVTDAQTNGGELDGWAPGIDIQVATLNDEYSLGAGTSLSAAIHSAVLVLNLDNLFEKTLLTIWDPNLFLSKASLSRENLLELDDEKYQNSVNKISTIFNNIPANINFDEDAFSVSTGFSKSIENAYHFLWIANPYTVEKVEILSDLPQDIKIYDSGRLYGPAPKLLDDQDSRLDTVSLKFTLRNQEIIYQDIKLLTIKDTYNFESALQDYALDPVLLEQACDACRESAPCENFSGQCQVFPACNQGTDASCTGVNFPKAYCYCVT